MKRLSDDISLSELTVPGTHMSAATGPVDWYKKTHFYRHLLDVQLRLGIRLWDFRCQHIKDTCQIYTGHQIGTATFEYPLKEAVKFLKMNPSESVQIWVREEGEPSGNTRTLAETMRSYLENPEYKAHIWPAEKYIPVLREVRGKIVIIDGIGRGTFGINAGRICPECVQDEWKIQSLAPRDIDQKFKFIVDHMNLANTGPAAELYFNFLSATGAGEGEAFPQNVSERINRKFAEHMDRHTSTYRRLGGVLMDFSISPSIRHIIRVNM